MVAFLHVDMLVWPMLTVHILGKAVPHEKAVIMGAIANSHYESSAHSAKDEAFPIST